MTGIHKLITILCVCLLAIAGTGATAQAEYMVIESDNPEYRPNTLFSAAEDLTAPRFDTLLSRYPLREIAGRADSEFGGILLLRNWLNERFVKDRSKSAERRNVLVMLEEGPQGGAYSCGHFETAFHAVLSAAGFVNRSLISGPDGTDPKLTGTHGSNEVWCNSMLKWVLVDAEHDAHFEKDGEPLSALELRQAYLDDGGQGVVRVHGPGREPQPMGRHDQWGWTPKSYAFVSWRYQVNRFSAWPDNGSSAEIVLDDEFFRQHIWHRGGRPHWAYDAGEFIRISDPDPIYWTPNVLDLGVQIDGAAARVEIESATPNLREYQLRRGEGPWEPVDSTLNLQLSEPRHEFRFRAVNLAGVSGPEFLLVLEQK